MQERNHPAVHPGYETFVSQLDALISSYPPPFIYVRDVDNPRRTGSIIKSVLDSLVASSTSHLTFACVNAVACFTPRLLYDTVLNALARWHPSWNDNCANWSGPAGAEGQRFNENFDGFLHGICAVQVELQMAAPTKSKGKGKARATPLPTVADAYQMVLVIERAERLKTTLPDLIVPLTRLAELSQTDISVIFVSDVPWEDVRPSFGSAPDPYFMSVSTMSKQSILETLSSSFPTELDPSLSSTLDPNTYHPALHPLYDQFISVLYSICAPFTHVIDELAYIAAARWPGFVQPVLDEHKRRPEYVADSEDEGESLPLPSEDARIRLSRLFTPSLTAALEVLYPRLLHAAEWARLNAPPPNLLSLPPAEATLTVKSVVVPVDISDANVDSLPRMSKFILVAAFLASTNPVKTDLRMFGRGLDERTKKRRRKMGTPRKSGARSTAVKIPQRLLGPTPFPLDRLIAILGVLLEEHDIEQRPHAPQYIVPGEYTETEISRVVVYAKIMELAALRLLHRTSPTEKLETSPTFKCGISYDLAMQLARAVGISLHDFMWEPT